MMLWERACLKDTAKMMALILGAVYFLFVLIDYSLRSRVFHTVEIPISDLVGYYICQFSRRANLLIPFALMVASIRLLTRLNIHNELIALLAAGVKKKRIVRPLLLMGAASAAVLYCNFAFAYPIASKGVERFESKYLFKSKRIGLDVREVTDGSKVVNGTYWLRKPGDVYCSSNHLVREKGQYVCKQEEIPWDDLTFNEVIPAEQLSYWGLWQRLPQRKTLSDREAKIVTQWSAKLALPLLCFLVVLAPAPFCLRPSRHLPMFTIYAVSIAGFLAFLTSMDAALILGEGHLVSPYWIAWIPLGLGFGGFSWQYSNL